MKEIAHQIGIFNKLFKFLSRIPCSIQAPNNSSHACPDYHIRDDSTTVKLLEHWNMSNAFCTAA